VDRVIEIVPGLEAELVERDGTFERQLGIDT
jgi:hypothetical protein